MTKKISSQSSQKKEFILTNSDRKVLKHLYENREGLRANTINKLVSFSRRNVYKRLNKLRDYGLVYNEYPVWKIVNGESEFVHSLLKGNDEVFELHNIGYIVKLVRKPKWWNPMGTQMKNRLMRIKNYQFKRVNWGKNNTNPYNQLKNDKYVIQMYPESIIIIHRKRYYSNNPYQTAMQFLQDFYDLWEWFEKRMKFQFFLDGVPQMTLRSNDYNRIDDWLSKKIKEQGDKFLVEIGDGRKVWVDLSEPFGKEANTPEMQEIMEKRTKDIILNKPYLPSELTEGVKSSINNIESLSRLTLRKEEQNNQQFKDLDLKVKNLTKYIDNLLGMNMKMEKQITLLTDIIYKLDPKKFK